MQSHDISRRPRGIDEDLAETEDEEDVLAWEQQHVEPRSLANVTSAQPYSRMPHARPSQSQEYDGEDALKTISASSTGLESMDDGSPSSSRSNGDTSRHSNQGPLPDRLGLDRYLHESGFVSSRSNPASTQTSSSSLHAMADVQRQSSSQSLDRIPSNISTHSSSRTRKLTHTKTASTSDVLTSRLSNTNHPVYPDQSFAALGPSRPSPILRTRSSHATQSTAYTDILRSPMQLKGKTVGNTPISSPGLFSPTGNHSSQQISTVNEYSPGGSPLWQPPRPKETHEATKQIDMYTGKKLINNYEIIDELGRGEHGKVKLGRDMNNDMKVAIKIVLRYSKRRRLGKLGAPEDRVKKEVAILKKARHPNVVGLLEVIDDPNMNKVYIVLEYVEGGEIKWRKLGVRDVLNIAHIRFEQERLGKPVIPDVRAEEKYVTKLAERRARHIANRAEFGALRETNFSNESGQYPEDDADYESPGTSGSISRQTSYAYYPNRGFQQEEQGVMSESPHSGGGPGSWINDFKPARKFSIATSAISHMSSEHTFEEPDDQRSYVPALTFEECRRAVRGVLLGLEFLHALGIIHRDIKPANLLVAKTGDIKISDFGVSYFGRPTSGEDPDSQVSETDATALDDPRELARSVGTPAFWAPELCYEDPSQFAEKDGPKITGALDLWSLGITLYCMVYARLPFYANGEMGLTEVICKSEVFLPSTRLVPVEMGSYETLTNGQEPRSRVPGKRSDYELEFEEVPESLRNLIQKLLIKDPVKRISISEAKKHPWIVEGLQDPAHWINHTNIPKETKTEILDIDDKEMSHAVVKLNIIERLASTLSKAMGYASGRASRNRGSSNVTSASASSDSVASPSASSGSTLGKNERSTDTRKRSLKGDEVVTALKASREASEHPLAQSQTASPEENEMSSYFPHSENFEKSASADVTPVPEQDRRPRGPDRAISAVSTTDSIRTIRPPKHMNRPPLLETSHEGDTPNLLESASHSLGAIFTGASKRLGGFRSRERRGLDDSRSSSHSRKSSESDAHGEPSLAISTASASGDFETPEALRDEVSLSEPDSSGSSPEIVAKPRSFSSFRPHQSSDAAFEQAQELNQRRLLQEQQIEAEKSASRPQSRALEDDCPPSPDDETYASTLTRQIMRESPMQPLPSQSTIASSTDEYNSSTSQSVSNPSIGVVSSASSPPGEMLFSPHKEQPQSSAAVVPEFMRTADTITDKTRPVATVAPALEDEIYDDDGDEEEGNEDEDEDEGIVMGGGVK